jgi:hypothetical protein
MLPKGFGAIIIFSFPWLLQYGGLPYVIPYSRQAKQPLDGMTRAMAVEPISKKASALTRIAPPGFIYSATMTDKALKTRAPERKAKVFGRNHLWGRWATRSYR